MSTFIKTEVQDLCILTLLYTQCPYQNNFRKFYLCFSFEKEKWYVRERDPLTHWLCSLVYGKIKISNFKPFSIFCFVCYVSVLFGQ